MFRNYQYIITLSLAFIMADMLSAQTLTPAANAPRTGDVLKKQQTEYVNTGGSIVLGYEQISPFPNPNMIGGQMPYQFERRIGFYNSNGLIDKPIPFSQFKTAVKKINKTR